VNQEALVHHDGWNGWMDDGWTENYFSIGIIHFLNEVFFHNDEMPISQIFDMVRECYCPFD
jgi:hypothetical protein